MIALAPRVLSLYSVTWAQQQVAVELSSCQHYRYHKMQGAHVFATLLPSLPWGLFGEEDRRWAFEACTSASAYP